MPMKIATPFAGLSLALAGCATMPPPDPARGAPVFASAQTAPVASREDAADDPAIWRNPADPSASLIVGTDKQAGLYVYGLDGAVRGFTQAGRVNNVDLRDGVSTAAGEAIIVAASDRNDLATARVALYRLDPASARLEPLGAVPAGAGEAYGMCLWRRARDGALFGFVPVTQGTIHQLRFDLSGEAAATTVRELRVPTQPEGCVVDDRTGMLYVGEEGAGIWRFAADPAAPATGELVARIAPGRLVADVEGLAIAAEGEDGGYLIASSQGDSAFAVYRLPGIDYVGRFYIAEGETIDAVTETDGIELNVAAFGADYPDGLLVVQDGATPAGTQNFKLVSWAAVKAALRVR